MNAGLEASTNTGVRFCDVMVTAHALGARGLTSHFGWDELGEYIYECLHSSHLATRKLCVAHIHHTPSNYIFPHHTSSYYEYTTHLPLMYLLFMFRLIIDRVHSFLSITLARTDLLSDTEAFTKTRVPFCGQVHIPIAIFEFLYLSPYQSNP